MAEQKKKHPSKLYRHKHVCLFRFVNFIGKTLCFWNRPSLSFNAVRKAAERTTKLKLDDGPLAPAERRTKDEKEAKLEAEVLDIKTPTAILFADMEKKQNSYTWIGRQFMRLYFQRHMEGRIRVIDYVRKNYDALQSVKIDKPIFVIGVPRTGTTYTLNLLAADPNNRYMPLWQGFGPTISEKEVRRATFIQMMIVKKMMPQLAAVHNLDLDEPEEDMVLLDYTFNCIMNCILLDLPNYKEYLLSDRPNWDATYRFHKYCLQVIQHRYPSHRVENGKELKEEKQWMLKAPVHLGWLGPLLEIYPDARIVWTHRNLSQSTVSMMSLLQYFRSISADEIDLAAIGDDATNIIKFIVDEAMKFRKKRPEIFYDLYYDELLKDPLGQCKKIYEHFNLPWTKETQEGISNSIRSRPQGKHGVHKYSAGAYGYTEGELEEVFGEYHEQFKIPTKIQKIVGSPIIA